MSVFNTLELAPIAENFRNIELMKLKYNNFYIYGQSLGVNE